MKIKLRKWINTGLGGLPKVDLEAPDGAKAEIYLHGAHVTSWAPPGGSERLFLSEKSEFHSGVAIRGGVPIIFPQFGALGKLPRHGFARTLDWDLISLSGDRQITTAVFLLCDNAASRSIWPNSFQVEYAVSVGGPALRLVLRVRNTGNSTLVFTGALHSYLRVEDIRETDVEGLFEARFHDTVDRATPADWIEKWQTDPEVHFPGEIDRVYYDIDKPLKIIEPQRITEVVSDGFPDIVIWNPGPDKAARLVDMEPEGYLHMLCVEAAIVGAPVQLEAGQTWQGMQLINS